MYARFVGLYALFMDYMRVLETADVTPAAKPNMTLTKTARKAPTF